MLLEANIARSANNNKKLSFFKNIEIISDQIKKFILLFIGFWLVKKRNYFCLG